MRTKLVTVLLLLLYVNFTNAQTKNNRIINEKRIINKDFSNLKSSDLVNLIPFYIKGQGYGYFNKRTKKEVVPPQYKRLELFKYNNNANSGYLTDDDFLFYLSPNEAEVSVTFGKPPEIIESITEESNNSNIISKKKDKIKEIQLNKFYKLISDSPELKYSNYYGPPFQIKNMYYLIVSKNGSQGIINNDGIPLKGFDFEHKYISKVGCNETDLDWFIFVDQDDNFGFINSNGTTKFYKEMGKLKYLSEIVGSPGGALCYRVHHDGDLIGVMDYRKME